MDTAAQVTEENKITETSNILSSCVDNDQNTSPWVGVGGFRVEIYSNLLWPPCVTL